MNPADVTWVYWVSRDSYDGTLDPRCCLWVVKPTRFRRGRGVAWESDHEGGGYLGSFRPEAIAGWWRVYPETDLELIRVETRPNAQELEESIRKAKGRRDTKR